MKVGDHIKFHDTAQAIARITSVTDTGFYGEHCTGGEVFVGNKTKFRAATTADLLAAQSDPDYIWPKITGLDVMPDLRPEGKLEAVGVLSRHGDPSNVGVWVDVVVKDAAGNQWFFPASTFADDLRPFKQICDVPGCAEEICQRFGVTALCQQHTTAYILNKNSANPLSLADFVLTLEQ